MKILHSIFGPSKNDIWRQVARDIGGHYDEKRVFDVLQYQSGEWEITLDTYSTGKNNQINYTRMRAPFLNKDELYFKIYKQGFIPSIGKMFGMQDIQIGDPFFDKEFIIKGNNEDKIRLLLKNSKLRELIHQQPDICFQIHDDEGSFQKRYPDGVNTLIFECKGVLRDEGLLKNLFNMFSITLERLVQIDSAYEDDPQVKL